MTQELGRALVIVAEALLDGELVGGVEAQELGALTRIIRRATRAQENTPLPVLEARADGKPLPPEHRSKT